MKKEIIQIIVKILLYALGLVAAYFGVSSFASCSIHRQFEHHGNGVLHYTDTFSVHGNNAINYNKYGK